MSKDAIVSMFTLSEIARRERFARQTVMARLENAGLAPDFELVCGSRRSPIFSERRMDAIRVALDAVQTPLIDAGAGVIC